MRLRTVSLAFLLAMVCTGVSWLTWQPLALRLVDALQRLSIPGSPERALVSGLRHTLPLLLAADLALCFAVAYLVLHLSVLRPLRGAERAIEQLGQLRLETDLPFERAAGSPLLARVQSALARLAEALRKEQSTTRRQLAELTAANQRLAHAQTELLASERLATVGKLAAGVAHEVGNPLAGILGYLSLAQGKTQDPQLRDFLARIEAEVQRIDQIVRGLLDLGRPAKGAATPVELAPLVENCVRLLGKSAELASVEVEISVEPGLMARADPGPLAQILINLLLNAAQAMGGRGRVQVLGRRDGDRVRLELSDSGPGIPAAVLPHIFEPFFTTRERGHGTGLGLAISLHLATTMGGSLTAGNRPEGGARFTLALPAT